MRVVVDTNVALSGLLWTGPPNQILRWARDHILEILACERTVDELRRALQYKRFSERLAALGVSPAEALAYFMNLVFFVASPKVVPKEISEDPFDNLFLALAHENKAHLIVSGDNHPLRVTEYYQIQIVTPSEACQVIEAVLKKTSR
jgi:putative PIN family toxin of toxin-antitoxin system